MDKGVIEAGKDVSHSKNELSLGNLGSEAHLLFLALNFSLTRRSHLKYQSMKAFSKTKERLSKENKAPPPSPKQSKF
jgi:hypothetical protein